LQGAFSFRRARRLGQLIAEQKATVGLNTGAKGIGKSVVPAENHTPTLASGPLEAMPTEIAVNYFLM
jgi:hypothetical protein